MRLLLACDSFGTASDALSTAARDTAVLAFDRLAFESLGAAENVWFVDDLLDWNAREALELEVGELLERLTADSALARSEIDGYPLLPTARYDLRIALTDLLRAHHAVTVLPCRDRLHDLAASASCSLATRLGAAAALGVDPGAVQTRAPIEAAKASTALRATNTLLRAYARARGVRGVRVLALPGGKVTAALASLSARELRRAGVGVAAFPVLVGGGAARLVLAKHLPAVVADRSADRPVDLPLPADRLADDPALDSALRALVTDILARVAPVVAHAAASARALEKCRSCRALVLPTVAVPTAHVLRTWALRRGMTCAVVQHGIYGFRDWDGGDRDADVLLAWGPGVKLQFNGGPDVRVIGVPGIVPPPSGRRTGDPHRILILTTNAPTGSAFGTYGFCEEFIGVVSAALPRLLEAGYEITLRPHPIEDPGRYRRMLGPFAARVTLSRSRRLADDIAASDLVVGSVTSAVFEAAACGLPTALWYGGAPLQIRARYLLPPFDADTPGTFNDAEGFTQLAASLARRDGAALAEMQELSAILHTYALPFDPQRLVEELAALAA
jgi:hypothetical protein